MNKIGFFERRNYYTNNDLKVLFQDKIQREARKVTLKEGHIISQKLIPIERIDPETGKPKVVDVKIINYVVTSDGKIHVIFEGENLLKLDEKDIKEEESTKKVKI